MFKSSVRMSCHVPYDKPNLLVISVMVFRLSSLKILLILSTFSSLRLVDGRPERSDSSTEKFPRVWIERTMHKFVFSQWHCHRKLFWAFHAFPTQFSRVWSKYHANALFFQISHFAYNRKWRFAINTHNNMQQHSVMAAKLTRWLTK